MSEKDELFSRKLDPVPPFRFNGEVVGVFDDMISRSVPFYRETLALCAALAAEKHREGVIYDLGCATGSLLAELIPRFGRAFRYTGYDNSPEMIAKASEKYSSADFQFKVADIQSADFTDASVIACNYTLQFIDPSGRPELLQRVARALPPGGMLFLSEKVKEDDESLTAVFAGVHADFKRTMGYSDLEIAQKREALDNVLKSLRVSETMALVKGAGFRSSSIAFKWCNFLSIVAVR